MHRRNLVIRRFGAMSFALGYYEDGSWVDHAVASDGSPAAMTPEDRAVWDAVHAFFECCGGNITPIHVVPETGSRLAGRSVRAAARTASS